MIFEIKKLPIRKIDLGDKGLKDLHDRVVLFVKQIVELNQDLNQGWQFQQVGETEWNPATVPGCVHLDLLQNKLIEDPFYRDNEKKVQWIDQENWEYRLLFDVNPEILSKKHIQLVFEGLDTYASIILNGQHVLDANNMFRAWQVDVRSILKERDNQLTVHFRSPILEVLPKIKTMLYQLPAVNDEPSPYTRKAPYHYGWDWGPRLITSGIWKSVKLEAWDNIKIIDLSIITKKITSQKAQLGVRAEVFSDIAEKAILRILDDRGKISETMQVNLQVGLNTLSREIEIIAPELWWPNGYGKQALYTIRMEISAGNERIHTTRRIGIRTLELKREQDRWGESFTFVVNGVPIFAKGANWIPSDNFTARVSKEKYRHLLFGAVQANMNMLRVWSGGIYEVDIFYDLCDELGLLVWQDFMFSCAMYPGDDAFLESVRAEADYQLRRLRHHPAIALWCGNNEIGEAWRKWYSQEKLPASAWDDYLALFYQVLSEVCAAQDPCRLYWPTSPGSDTAPSENPQDASCGDTHYWGVWHDKEPFEKYKQHHPRFISEFGFQSFPEPSSTAKFTTEADHDIFSPVIYLHQRNPKGNSLIKGYMEQYYAVPKDFNRFLLLSQVLQAEGVKLGAEHFRRLRPRCMGSLYWQLNDCWPVASWSSIDYFGRWKALHYYARRFYAPILISPSYENGAYNFYVISDKTEQVEAKIRVRLLDFFGDLLFQADDSVRIESLKSAVYFSLEKNALTKDIDPTKMFLYCDLEIGGRVISENTLYFVPPKELRLSSPEIHINITPDDSGFSIMLSSKNLVRAVILSLNPIDGHFEDNFFDLYPGQIRVIRFLTNVKSEVTEFKNAFSILTLYELMEL